MSVASVVFLIIPNSLQTWSQVTTGGRNILVHSMNMTMNFSRERAINAYW